LEIHPKNKTLSDASAEADGESSRAVPRRKQRSIPNTHTKAAALRSPSRQPQATGCERHSPARSLPLDRKLATLQHLHDRALAPTQILDGRLPGPGDDGPDGPRRVLRVGYAQLPDPPREIP
jgi:hypothetical protein